ncbi:MAG: restriction endonuclease subunit S [Pseudomonas sp.]|uniref:restriction endonuclease subunit S n=1 Tax=Pseudomonas sp. TaxID=306 RepID=UPI002719D8F1|nr:restriction endonuclease subunit S [Pseudomonas sp.]MDO9616221.1 restriction endonuclease subunit S [Pseudomonas sp.]MDP2447794.1 restriction endonuclease subunit S [Pseudomonas sp.]
MTALLTDNLPLLAGAPNGIKKLRELILELAVRGKLVPQDPSDEPASELLKRIAEEKSRLLTAGKKLKHQAEISKQEQPFSVPVTWSWVRLGSCLEMINGRAFKPTEWIAAGLPIVRIQNLNKPDAPFNYCNPDAVDDRHVIDTGTILISWSGTPGTSFGAFIWERGKAALNQHIFSCFQVGDAFFDKFLKLAINTRLEELIAKAHGGVGLQHVTKGKLEALTLVLPPLAEQHRIVAKVDELMALCDRLEAHQSDAESAHTQLVQALLDSLPQASDATDFAANWQRLAEHFHTLFTTESSIDALKQTLLQLAVMGKLVPQDPSDESASELLSRAWEINVKLERTLPSEAGGDDAERWFGISAPKGWCVCKVSNIAEVKLGSTPSRAESSYWGGDIPWVSSGEVAGTIIESTRERITLAGHKNSSTVMIPPGSVLIAMIGQGKTRGQSALLEIEACTNQNVAALIFNTELVASRYVWLWAQAMYSLHRADGHGGAQPALNAKKVKAFSLPLPPTAEQHRIVAKIDQLMAICDQLKTRLTQARHLNQIIASTLVQQATN